MRIIRTASPCQPTATCKKKKQKTKPSLGRQNNAAAMPHKISFSIFPPPRGCYNATDICALFGVLSRPALWVLALTLSPFAHLPLTLANRVLSHFVLLLDDWEPRLTSCGHGKAGLPSSTTWACSGQAKRPSRPGPSNPLAPGLVARPWQLTASSPSRSVTGFLARKTTLIASLLGHPAWARQRLDRERAGEIGIDHHLLRRVDERTVLQDAPCSRCGCDRADELRVDLLGRRDAARSRVRRTFRRRDHRLADPAPGRLHALSEPFVKHHYDLACIVTTVRCAARPFVGDRSGRRPPRHAVDEDGFRAPRSCRRNSSRISTNPASRVLEAMFSARRAGFPVRQPAEHLANSLASAAAPVHGEVSGVNESYFDEALD